MIQGLSPDKLAEELERLEVAKFDARKEVGYFLPLWLHADVRTALRSLPIDGESRNEVLAEAGNGRILTRSDVEEVIDRLETDAVEYFEDAVRLLRYMADELAALSTPPMDVVERVARAMYQADYDHGQPYSGWNWSDPSTLASGKYPASWEPYLRRARAAIAALSTPQPIEPVCEHCGGNGYSGGVMPAEDMRGEYDCACEVCLGTGKQRRPQPIEGEDVVERLAAMPCETRGAEDLEPGCCRTCRARAALSAAPQPEDLGVSASPPGCQPTASASLRESSQSGIPDAGRGDFESVISVRRETPFSGHVHLGVGKLTVSGQDEAAVAIEVGHPDAADGIVTCFALRLPTFAVLLEAMMECFTIAQGMAAATAGETRSGSTEGNSPVREADAPVTSPSSSTSGGRDD